MEAKGHWIKQRGRQVLLWIIDGKFVSDAALQTWIFHNNDGYAKYVHCVTARHTEQWSTAH